MSCSYQQQQMLSKNTNLADRVLTIDEAIDRVGDRNIYQLKMLFQFLGVFLFSSFVQMGFPVIFQPAQFECPQGQDCTQDTLCKGDYRLSPDIKSVAYSFNLVCDRKKYLTTCFEAFLYGGFIGSLYYGEIIERRGRKYAVNESLLVMVAGLTLSVVSGSAVLFSLGVFAFNFGFRGFYNAALLSISQVSSKVMRTASPMALSIGWALGQIILAIICLFLINWRVIFLITVVPLAVLLFMTYRHVRDSPRFCVSKHEFATAKTILLEIGQINDRNPGGFELKEQLEFNSKIDNYRNIMQGGQFSSRQVHHSYLSLFRFNSIRIRVLFVSIIWSVVSLSYFISAKSQLNPQKSYTFNLAFAGIIEIIAYLSSVATNINLKRLFVLTRLIVVSAAVHLCFYFVQPQKTHSGVAKVGIFLLQVAIRISMAYGNTFLAIYSIELFPTSIRHFALGMLGFITKLMYMLSFIFDQFFNERYIHPNFIIGILFVGCYFLIPKLRETEELGIKDNLSEDADNLLMNENYASIF